MQEEEVLRRARLEEISRDLRHRVDLDSTVAPMRHDVVKTSGALVIAPPLVSEAVPANEDHGHSPDDLAVLARRMMHATTALSEQVCGPPAHPAPVLAATV